MTSERIGKGRAAVIGAGVVGCTVARELAEAGCWADVYESRSHVGGNCFDELDEQGVRVHRYGPHYFRTHDRELLQWLSRFTEWVPGRYYVRARVDDGRLVPMPVSLATMTDLKGRAFSEEDFRAYLDEQREAIQKPSNAEEQCLSTVGRELYELLFAGYTQKQWGVPAAELDASITARIPLRFDWDERYVNEKFQVMPKKGYAALFTRMLDHDGIDVTQGRHCDAETVLGMRSDYDAIIFTGPVDMLFGYAFGELGYRSLRFEWKTYEERYAQPCVQINYSGLDVDYTRTVETKHVTGQTGAVTTVCYEYPCGDGEPYYPLLTPEHQRASSRYEELAAREAAREKPIICAGRLAEFKYYNMDHAFLRGREVAQDLLLRLDL